jgi:hypothetical protein
MTDSLLQDLILTIAPVLVTLAVQRVLPYWVKLGPKFWAVYPKVSLLLKAMDSRLSEKVGLMDQLVEDANEALADGALSAEELARLRPGIEKAWSMLVLARRQRG